MKIFSTLVFLIAISFSITAQRTANIALSGGVVNYVGDLGNEKKFPVSSVNSGASITIRDFINNPFRSGTRFPALDMQLRFSWHRLQYDETDELSGKRGVQLRNYMRGINFRNDLFGSEVDFTYNMYSNRFAPGNKPRINLFFLAGVGVFYGKPMADLFNGSVSPENRYYFWKDGSVRNAPENDARIGDVISKDGEYETDLSEWNTEGQGVSKEAEAKNTYSNWNIGFPLGAGIRYIANTNLAFSLEFSYYYFLTDYLDDVSDRYATYQELRTSFPDDVEYELSKYISDPTGFGTVGNDLTASPRGNPGQKDSFTYLSVEASYKITWRKRGIYGR